MVTSTQRLLLIIIIINALVSISVAMYESPRSINYDNIIESVNIGDTIADRTEGEQAQVNPENLQEEGSFGSALRMGSTIMILFVRGLIALPFDTDMYPKDTVMWVLSFPLLLMWVLMYSLIAFEMIVFFKNRKAT